MYRHSGSGAWGRRTLLAGLLPLPIGYAIARYRLFDLGLAMRRAITARRICADGMLEAFVGSARDQTFGVG